MDTQKQIKDLTDQLTALQSTVNELSGQVYKNNFSGSQTFNKAAIFNDRLKVPVFSATPTVAEVGDLIAIGGTLYICTNSSPVTWTIVGTQT